MKKKKFIKTKAKKIFFVSFMVLVFFASAFIFSKAIKAQTEASVQGSAQVLNTSKYLYFTGYNSNVKINKITQEFSGYAWSEDLGWVAFGTADNPEGPVSLDTSTGAVSGKATIIDTGSFLDFNSPFYSSNVTISSDGVFSGYAWSEDVGWINFSGVNCPDVSFNLPEAGAVIEEVKSNLVYYLSLLIVITTGTIILMILVGRIIKIIKKKAV